METFAVFLLLSVAGNSCHDHRPMDLSGDCCDNLKLNYFLTHGMGYVDGLSVYIGNFNKNCTLNVYTNQVDVTTVQIVVLEAVTYVEWDGFCENNAIIIADESTVINPCAQLHSSNGNILFVGVLNNQKTVVNVRGNSTDMLKVTATSAKHLRENDRCSSEEIECVVTNRLLCINIDLMCDGNINCGGYGMFDEDTLKCHSENYKKHVTLIIPGLLLFAITLLIIAKLCRHCLPKIPLHFYQTDNLEDNKLIVTSREKKPSPERKELERIEEKEIRTLYYEKPPKKRLTTNSPVYRNTRVATILLDDIKNMPGGNGFFSEADLQDSQSVVYQTRNYNKRRHTISDFI